MLGTERGRNLHFELVKYLIVAFFLCYSCFGPSTIIKTSTVLGLQIKCLHSSGGKYFVDKIFND